MTDLGSLRLRLLDAGYTPAGVSDTLGPLAEAALARGERVPALRVTAEPTVGNRLIRIFLLGTDEPDEQLDWLGPPFLHRQDGRVRAALDLRPYGQDSYVVSDLAVGPDTVTGVGGASLMLAAAAVPGRVGRALDVGTGSGVQALHLAARSDQVVATDSNPRCLQLAALTLGLSAVRGVGLRHGDLLGPVLGQRFDLVVSNPPFVAGPAEREALSYRDSGQAGDALCAALTAALGGVLAPGGVGQLLANWLLVAGADWRERVAGWLPDGCDAWVLQREVQDPAEYVGLWLRDAGQGADDAAYDRWLDWFERQHVEGVGFGVVTVRRTDAQPRILLEEARQPLEGALGVELARWLRALDVLRGGDPVLRPAAGLTLEQVAAAGASWLPTQSALVGPPPLRWRAEVDEHTLALVAGCDGVTPLGEVAARTAAAAGLDRQTASAVLRALLERGYLVGSDPGRNGGREVPVRT